MPVVAADAQLGNPKLGGAREDVVAGRAQPVEVTRRQVVLPGRQGHVSSDVLLEPARVCPGWAPAPLVMAWP